MNAPLSWLELRRAKAARTFGDIGVPHGRAEQWKYSRVHSLVEAETVKNAGLVRWRTETSGSVDCFDLSSGFGVPEWVVSHLGSQMRVDNFDTASFAFASGGPAIRVRAGEQGQAKVSFESEGQARFLIVVEEGGSLQLIETAWCESDLQNIGAEIVLMPHSRLDHVRICPKSNDAIQIGASSINIGAGATYLAHFANFGTKLSRTDLLVWLEGENAKAHLSGATLLGESRHADITTHVEHRVPDAESTQLFKIIAGGKSRGVYQGKISVAEGANGSDSRQTAKGLLLGERAEIDLKPELEILADDVKCAHGAAVGDLDPESLFYLRSRGVPEAEARALLMRAFLEDAVAEIADETVRADVWSRVEAALAEMSA